MKLSDPYFWVIWLGSLIVFSIIVKIKYGFAGRWKVYFLSIAIFFIWPVLINWGINVCGDPLLYFLGVPVMFIPYFLFGSYVFKLVGKPKQKDSQILNQEETGKGNEMNYKTKIIIFALVLANLVTAWFLGKSLWTNFLWKDEMYGMATYAARLQAAEDFRANKFRIFELVKEGQFEFTKRYGGPYEIWSRPYYGKTNEYTQKIFAHSYNTGMRNMYDIKGKKTGERNDPNEKD